MRLVLGVISLLLTLSCGDNNPVSYTPPINTTTILPDPEPTKPPRVDQQPDLYSVRGVTAFGMAKLSEDGLLSYINHCASSGVDIFRVGFWTDGWAGGKSYIDEAAGPPAGSPESIENVRRLLDITSRIPNVYIQAIPTFTHKQHGFARCQELVELSIQLVEEHDYKHVVWETFNEYRHPISTVSLSQVVQLTRRLGQTGMPVGTDFGGGRDQPWEGYYPPELKPHVDYIAFHPPRNDYNYNTKKCTPLRPSFNRLRKVINSFGKPVWIDEPECYVSDESIGLYGIGRGGLFTNCGGGTETYRRRLQTEYMNDVERAGGIWFQHYVAGFSCDRLGWLPN